MDIDHNIELRYYEILFTKTLLKFHRLYKLERLTTFVELLVHLSDASPTLVTAAMSKVLTNDAAIKIHRDEYLVCMSQHSGYCVAELRKLLKVSPNTIYAAITAYNNKDLFITHRFPLEQSNEIRKVMKALRAINNIY
jgi:hypothetical protein